MCLCVPVCVCLPQSPTYFQVLDQPRTMFSRCQTATKICSVCNKFTAAVCVGRGVHCHYCHQYNQVSNAMRYQKGGKLDKLKKQREDAPRPQSYREVAVSLA